MPESGRSQHPTPPIAAQPRASTPYAAKGPHGRPAVVLVEEGMREGLQIEDAGIPLADRVRLLEALSRTGLRRIVVGSFVSPKWTPQMAAIDELVASFTPNPDVIYTALALNAKGVERRDLHIPPLSLDGALPATHVHLCDVFARRNTNRSQEAEIDSWDELIARAVDQGATEAQIGLGAAWGSNWLGLFSHDQRMEMLSRQWERWSAAGIEVTKVSLADPMGWHMPDQVEEDLTAIQERWPSVLNFHLHLHNTRGTAPITAYAVLRVLDDRHTVVLDSSIGGMAGCPYCGNGRAATLIPTEDLVYLLQELGYDTGIDLDALIDAALIAEEVVGHALYGHVSKAGGRPRGNRLYPMDLPFIETLAEARHFRDGPAAYRGAMSPWESPITSPHRDRLMSATPSDIQPGAPRA